MSSPRRWRVDLAVVLTLTAVLLAALPANAQPPGESFGGVTARLLNLQAPDPGLEPPKMDAPPITPATVPATETTDPYYKTPKFWLVAGVALIGAVALVWGGSQLIHEVNGGDPRPCSATAVACAGEGR